MPRLKLITFDLDNTLWDVRLVIGRAEKTMRNWLAEHAPLMSTAYQDGTVDRARNALLREKPDIVHDLSQFRHQVLFRALQQCGYAEDIAQQHADTAFEIFYRARNDVVYFEGALETLAHLSQEYVLGALTNGNADIQMLGLQDVFSFHFSSASVGIGKPAPDMFHAALEHSGVAPSDAVHVGDSLTDDIHGASQVGMHSIWFNPGRSMRDATIAPSAEIYLLTDLPAVIEAINGR
ncbi:MAG: HAD-IA family hydrolase [Proteobacteria bacterium]|nr:HAD-IA family hydrolase [Pseudomonadota bacterium]